MDEDPGMEYFKREFALKIARDKDTQLMNQLNWLVSRGIIVIETRGGKFLQRDRGGLLEYTEDFQLVVKDKEYIEKLEVELKALREFKDSVEEIVRGAEQK